MAAPERNVNVLALDEALHRLAALNQRQSRAVELRYFGDLSEEEMAEVLKVSVWIVEGDWRLARLWLHRALSEGSAELAASDLDVLYR